MTTSISTEEVKVTVYIGNIIHCSKPFQVQTFEKGYVATYGREVRSITYTYIIVVS